MTGPRAITYLRMVALTGLLAVAAATHAADDRRPSRLGHAERVSGLSDWRDSARLGLEDKRFQPLAGRSRPYDEIQPAAYSSPTAPGGAEKRRPARGLADKR